jgi:hypothetical protein
MSIRKPLVYLSHPYEGEKSNLDLAEAWLARFSLHFPSVLFHAPWIPLCRQWPNGGDFLSRGMQIDKSMIGRSDALLLVGRKLTRGMHEELNHAKEMLKPVIPTSVHLMMFELEPGHSTHAELAERFGEL